MAVVEGIEACDVGPTEFGEGGVEEGPVEGENLVNHGIVAGDDEFCIGIVDRDFPCLFGAREDGVGEAACREGEFFGWGDFDSTCGGIALALVVTEECNACITNHISGDGKGEARSFAGSKGFGAIKG